MRWVGIVDLSARIKFSNIWPASFPNDIAIQRKRVCCRPAIRAHCGHCISGLPRGLILIPSAYGRCWGSLKGRPLPIEQRRRVVDFVSEFHTHRAAAAQFRVWIKFVNDMVQVNRHLSPTIFLICRIWKVMPVLEQE
jgi:hypothetical protein